MAEWELYFVAFIDILGFSKMVEDDIHSESTVFLEKLFRVYRKSKEMISGECNITQFSDSIIISRRYAREKFKSFIEVVSMYQKMLLEEKLLCRGGIAFGRHFQDADFVFSEALIKAYYIECTEAKYPRIVISNDLIDLVDISDLTGSELIRENDNTVFVNYLNVVDDEERKLILESLRDLYAQYQSNSKIRAKLLWLLQYADYVFKTNHAPPKFSRISQFVNGG